MGYSAWGHKVRHDLATKQQQNPKGRFIRVLFFKGASLVTHMVKNPPAKQETQFCSLGWEDPLEKGPATHSSILRELSVFWRIPWTVWTVGSQRVGPG